MTPVGTQIATERRGRTAPRGTSPQGTRAVRNPRFFRSARIWVPTRAGWAVVLFLLAAFGVFLLVLASRLHGFLAEDRPVETDTLVVEGWLPDDALEAAAGAYARGEYRRIVTVGGPIRLGRHLSPYGVSARLSAATLEALGVPRAAIVCLPTAKVDRDRTYEEGLALASWIAGCDSPPRAVNLLTLGVHARRSRILFQLALGDRAKVGVISTEVAGYDPRGWWKSSEGVKTVLYEAMAYAYTVLFFHPE